MTVVNEEPIKLDRWGYVDYKTKWIILRLPAAADNSITLDYTQYLANFILPGLSLLNGLPSLPARWIGKGVGYKDSIKIRIIILSLSYSAG